MRVWNYNGVHGNGEHREISSLEEGLELHPYGMFAVDADEGDVFNRYIFCKEKNRIVCQQIEGNIRRFGDDLYDTEAINKFKELIEGRHGEKS
jgi:hypothetical protein